MCVQFKEFPRRNGDDDAIFVSIAIKVAQTCIDGSECRARPEEYSRIEFEHKVFESPTTFQRYIALMEWALVTDHDLISFNNDAKMVMTTRTFLVALICEPEQLDRRVQPLLLLNS